MPDFEYLYNCMWADCREDTGNRVYHVPVRLYRHRQSGQLAVILLEDLAASKPPGYEVTEDQLILPPGGLPEDEAA